MTKQKPERVLRQILKDVSPADLADYSADLSYVPGGNERLPMPYMVWLTFLLGTDCKCVPRPEEKTAWAITFRFEGSLFQLEHGKFGMRIATSALANDPLVDELIRVLNKAFPVVDRVLRPIADEQVQEGNVTVQNRHHLFRDRYNFFRHRTQESFALPKPNLFASHLSESCAHGQSINLFKGDREGFFYGSAAIDAYFSWLEHILVLLLPFRGYNSDSDDLVKFMGAFWTDKLKRVWNVPTDTVAKMLYDQLINIKERFRNSLAHGGLEKDGLSVFIQVPGLGAVPARLSKFTESIHYGIFPLEASSFDEACSLFNEVDTYLREGPTRFGMKFVESGLDVAFDKETISSYRGATGSDDEFNALLHYLSYEADRSANMDW